MRGTEETGRRLTVLAVGGPTAVLELGGLRLLTDPTFDPPGEYRRPGGSTLTKTAGPAVEPEALGRIDAVLLSHDQHSDNLDSRGRELLARVPLVLTTPSGAGRLGGAATALANWAHVELARPGGGEQRVTGVPALHGPPGLEAAVGEVTGFVLDGAGLPTVYVSGDNASVDVVREIAERIGRVEVAVLFAGAARTPLLGDALLTLDGERAAEAAAILDARRVVPLHVDGWRHFGEDAGAVSDAFARAGLADRLVLLAPGESATL